VPEERLEKEDLEDSEDPKGAKDPEVNPDLARRLSRRSSPKLPSSKNYWPSSNGRSTI